MASPIHSALFSPPPSPPTKNKETVDIHTKHGIISLKAILLPNDVMGRSNFDHHPASAGAELNFRSPRTPQQRQFSLDNTYPSPYASSRQQHSQQDVEATPRASASATTPKAPTSARTPKTMCSPPFLPSNIPSKPLPVPSALPRPLLRLFFLASLVVSSVMMLLWVPAARLPSLRTASLSRRLAWATDESDFMYLGKSIQGWTDAVDRDYKPPQVRVPHMMKRAFGVADVNERDMVAAPPKAFRPERISRPLPESHELLAIQSYLLDSSYNILPTDIDPSSPVDATRVSNYNLGKPGSEEEKAWLEELEKEHGQEVVIWYGGDGSAVLPHDILDVLHALHGAARHPTMIPCHTRSDLPLLKSIFERLSFPIQHFPLVMIGSTPIIGDVDLLEELRGSGKLAEMLRNIGWINEEPKVERQEVDEPVPEVVIDEADESNSPDTEFYDDEDPLPADQDNIDLIEDQVIGNTDI